MLFYVISDLFRDTQLNGWFKALWFLALIVLPVLTALVYVIFRGRGMQERSLAAAKADKAATDSYIRHAVGGVSPAEQIQTAKALLDEGTIDEAEFAQLKAHALSATRQPV